MHVPEALLEVLQDLLPLSFTPLHRP